MFCHVDFESDPKIVIDWLGVGKGLLGVYKCIRRYCYCKEGLLFSGESCVIEKLIWLLFLFWQNGKLKGISQVRSIPKV